MTKVTQCGYCDRTLIIKDDYRREQVEVHGKWFCNIKCAYKYEYAFAQSLPPGEELCHIIAHTTNVEGR